MGLGLSAKEKLLGPEETPNVAGLDPPKIEFGTGSFVSEESASFGIDADSVLRGVVPKFNGGVNDETPNVAKLVAPTFRLVDPSEEEGTKLILAKMPLVPEDSGFFALEVSGPVPLVSGLDGTGAITLEN